MKHLKVINFCIVMSFLSRSAWALTYQEAIDNALAQAPQLQAQQNAVMANKALEISSGRLPDPNLVLGVDNLPISGKEQYSTTDDFMTMKKVGVMQDIPNADKRSAEQKLATATTQVSKQVLASQRLSIQRDTALAWLMIYYIKQKQEINKSLIANNQQVIDNLTKAVNSGRANNQTDLIAAQQTRLELIDQQDLLALDVVRAQNQLHKFIGDKASEPLTGQPPTLSVDAKTLTQHLNNHPDIAQYDALNDKAQAELLAAEADKKPDWGVGVTYQNRSDSFGDMASIEFKMGLPLFSSTRQDPTISAKQHELTEVAYERDAMYRDHSAELTSDVATYETLLRQIGRIEKDRLPIAKQNIAEIQTRYNAAQVELRELNTAKQGLYELQLQKLDLQFQRDALATKLHYLQGDL